MVVHRDRMAPYRGRQMIGADTGDSGDNQRPDTQMELLLQTDTPTNDPDGTRTRSIVREEGPMDRPRRVGRPPGRLKDFVCALGVEGL